MFKTIKAGSKTAHTKILQKVFRVSFTDIERTGVFMPIIIYELVVIASLFLLCHALLKRKNIDIWIWEYLKNAVAFAKPQSDGPVDIMFCFVDHFEPKWENAEHETARDRVKKWVASYPSLVTRHFDSDGKHPQHTWFYPQEEYEVEYLEMLNEMCAADLGEIELHLHHHNDTCEGFRLKIRQAMENFQRHGACITTDDPAKTIFGFIHGNWALDNSHEKGLFCGVNNELQVLSKEGCYADFTLPSAPSSCQTKKINSIYYALDDPNAPKSHNNGTDVRVGEAPKHDLMIIQGPLCLDFKNRKFGFFPRIENGEISGCNPATKDRIEHWIDQWIHVKGKPSWVFIKIHCHGAQEAGWKALLGSEADEMYRYLEQNYNDGERYRLHYVTARECFNIIKAAEAGESEESALIP